MANVTGVVQWVCHEYGVFFSQKQLLHLLTLLTSSTLLTFGNIQTSFDIALSQIAMLHLWKIRKFDSFSCQKELLVLARNPEPPKNPSLLPQNRFKCFRRTFIPPRQKLALYGALKRAVKILRILLPSKCCYKYINNQSFSLASTDLERVGLTILQILQILQAETRQGVS